MAGITTAVCDSAKADAMFSALHNFNVTVTPTGNTHTNNTIDSLSSGTGIAVGMGVSGTGIQTGTVVTGWNSATSISVYPATTATNTGVTLTFTGDVFKCALIKFGMTGTYGETSTNYTDVTGNSDEASGTGYSAGGFTLTNAGPAITSPTAYTSFTVNPSWTSATLDVEGCVFYNSSQRGPVATRAISFNDFGGEQKVTAGTLTVILPTNNSSNALYRVS